MGYPVTGVIPGQLSLCSHFTPCSFSPEDALFLLPQHGSRCREQAAASWTLSPVSLLSADAEMLFWGLDSALVTESTRPCCSLSLTHLSPWECDLQGICHREFFLVWTSEAKSEVGNSCTESTQNFALKAHGRVFSTCPWGRCSKSEWQRKDLLWPNSLLSSCVSLFLKLNPRWEHVVVHSLESNSPSLNGISKQCEQTQDALLDLRCCMMSLHAAMT